MQFISPSDIPLPFTIPAHLELTAAIGAAFFIALIAATILRRIL